MTKIIDLSDVSRVVLANDESAYNYELDSFIVYLNALYRDVKFDTDLVSASRVYDTENNEIDFDANLLFDQFCSSDFSELPIVDQILVFESIQKTTLNTEQRVAFEFLIDVCNLGFSDVADQLEHVQVCHAAFLNEYVRDLVSELISDEFALRYFDFDAFKRDLDAAGDICEIRDGYYVINPRDFT